MQRGRANGWIVHSVRHLLGRALGLFVRLWLQTLRLQLAVHPGLEAVASSPWVLAFHHGRQWPLLAWSRRRPTVVMVSLSRDGELQSGALRSLGLSVVRGSSSRSASRGLAALIRELRKGGRDAAFAVDGPRGPRGVPKPGAFAAAQAVGGVVVPLGSAMVTGKVFLRAWDRFEVAWPFSRVSVVLGAPILANESPSLDALGHAIAQVNRQAEELLHQEVSGQSRRAVRNPLGAEPREVTGDE